MADHHFRENPVHSSFSGPRPPGGDPGLTQAIYARYRVGASGGPSAAILRRSTDLGAIGWRSAALAQDIVQRWNNGGNDRSEPLVFRFPAELDRIEGYGTAERVDSRIDLSPLPSGRVSAQRDLPAAHVPRRSEDNLPAPSVTPPGRNENVPDVPLVAVSDHPAGFGDGIFPPAGTGRGSIGVPGEKTDRGHDSPLRLGRQEAKTPAPGQVGGFPLPSPQELPPEPDSRNRAIDDRSGHSPVSGTRQDSLPVEGKRDPGKVILRQEGAARRIAAPEQSGSEETSGTHSNVQTPLVRKVETEYPPLAAAGEWPTLRRSVRGTTLPPFVIRKLPSLNQAKDGASRSAVPQSKDLRGDVAPEGGFMGPSTGENPPARRPSIPWPGRETGRGDGVPADGRGPSGTARPILQRSVDGGNADPAAPFGRTSPSGGADAPQGGQMFIDRGAGSALSVGKPSAREGNPEGQSGEGLSARAAFRREKIRGDFASEKEGFIRRLPGEKPPEGGQAIRVTAGTPGRADAFPSERRLPSGSRPILQRSVSRGHVDPFPSVVPVSHGGGAGATEEGRISMGKGEGDGGFSGQRATGALLSDSPSVDVGTRGGSLAPVPPMTLRMKRTPSPTKASQTEFSPLSPGGALTSMTSPALQRSGGEGRSAAGTTAEPVAAPPSSAGEPAPTSAPFRVEERDLDRIADQVYALIERRLRVEKENRGL